MPTMIMEIDLNTHIHN